MAECVKDAYYVCDFLASGRYKSLRATTRYIDLFPPAITVKLARHFVQMFISVVTTEMARRSRDVIRQTGKMFPALLKVSLRRQQIENIRSFIETISFFYGTKFQFGIMLVLLARFLYVWTRAKMIPLIIRHTHDTCLNRRLTTKELKNIPIFLFVYLRILRYT